MKKIFALILALILTATLLVGCGGDTPAETTAAPETTIVTPPESTPDSTPEASESTPTASESETDPETTPPATAESTPDINVEPEPDGLSLNGVEISVYAKTENDIYQRSSEKFRTQCLAGC